MTAASETLTYTLVNGPLSAVEFTLSATELQVRGPMRKLPWTEAGARRLPKLEEDEARRRLGMPSSQSLIAILAVVALAGTAVIAGVTVLTRS